MKLIKVSSDSYPKWIELSTNDTLYVFLRDALSSASSDYSDKLAGVDGFSITVPDIRELSEALRVAVNSLVSKYVPAEYPTNSVDFESQKLHLNVRRDVDRQIAHLLLILNIAEHSIERHEQLEIGVREE